MAVIVKYVVVRDGKEDMIFATKKEADAYDKMLDTAERLYTYLQHADLGIPDDQLDALTFFIAQHHDEIGRLLKGGTLKAPEAAAQPPPAAEADADAPTSSEPKSDKPSKRPRTAPPKSAAA
jgi:dsDNA-binding SOS-regulon protein